MAVFCAWERSHAYHARRTEHHLPLTVTPSDRGLANPVTPASGSRSAAGPVAAPVGSGFVRIALPREVRAYERRVALVPSVLARLTGASALEAKGASAGWSRISR